MREKNVFLNSSLGEYEYTSNTLKELTTQNFATDALQKLQQWWISHAAVPTVHMYTTGL